MTATEVVIGTCERCSARLARDNRDVICSPCRRTGIETSARRASSTMRDAAGATRAFRVMRASPSTFAGSFRLYLALTNRIFTAARRGSSLLLISSRR